MVNLIGTDRYLAAMFRVYGQPNREVTLGIRTGRPGEAERSFRYAPLASGLDIVRKTLGQHEIATVQTTEIDRAAGVVNLRTMLAHASGEWIASDWPVCPIADTASPRRMGAALTYARRYALFTLVGIAGEDDLDAPDLCYPGSSSAATPPARSAGNGRSSAFGKATPPVLLGATLSASLREMLLAEISAPRRYRNREHLRAIIKQPCLVCGRKPSDPHHLRFAQPKALGRKASDEFAVPLCRMHHREVHLAGDERAWWKAAGIDPLKVAHKLWKEARVNEGRVAPNSSSKLDDQKRAVTSPDPSNPLPSV
jgi:hypothetical protein